MKYLKNILLFIFVLLCFYMIIKNLKQTYLYMEGMNVDVELEIRPKKESCQVNTRTRKTGTGRWNLLSTSTVGSISSNANRFGTSPLLRMLLTSSRKDS